MVTTTGLRPSTWRIGARASLVPARARGERSARRAEPERAASGIGLLSASPQARRSTYPLASEECERSDGEGCAVTAARDEFVHAEGLFAIASPRSTQPLCRDGYGGFRTGEVSRRVLGSSSIEVTPNQAFRTGHGTVQALERPSQMYTSKLAAYMVLPAV